MTSLDDSRWQLICDSGLLCALGHLTKVCRWPSWDIVATYCLHDADGMFLNTSTVDHIPQS